MRARSPSALSLCIPVTFIDTFVGSLVSPELGAHAIVNASNPELGLGSGVSGAIREACGGVEFQHEVRRAWADQIEEPLEAEDCVVSGAGTATAFRWVLHVAAVDYRKRDPQTGGSSGPARVRACTQAAIAEAVHLARTNDLIGQLILGVPLLGAGHGGLGHVASAGAMMEALANAPGRADVGGVLFAVLKEQHALVVRHAAERFGLG